MSQWKRSSICIGSLVAVSFFVAPPRQSAIAMGRASRAPAELQDIALMQGANTPDGPVRSVKEIEGARTVLKRYDANDALIWGHRSEFKVRIQDRVKIFTFYNVEVTDGRSRAP